MLGAARMLGATSDARPAEGGYHGTFVFSTGDMFCGSLDVYGKPRGRGILYYTGSGECDVSTFDENLNQKGEGVRYSKDRDVAYRLFNGEAEGGSVDLDEALEITGLLETPAIHSHDSITPCTGFDPARQKQTKAQKNQRRTTDRQLAMLAHARAAMATTCDDSGGSPRHLGYHVQTELMEEKCWQKYSDCEAPDFFEVLDFARDGGFAEVHELWNVMRYVGAVLAIGMMISNLATIVINDSHYLISSAHIERSSSNVTDDDASYVASISEDYMISGMLVDSIFYIVSDVTGLDIQIRSPRIALVGALELILLCLLVMKAFSCIMWSLTTDNQRLRWSMAMTLFWETIPELTSFSAMRLLHFATPSVVIADLFIFMEYSKARGKHDGRFTQIRLWVQFVLGKLACLVLGIDAFLFKVRIAYRNIHKQDIQWFGLLSVAMFIVQVLGIVQLSMFVRGRIFLFIFGGEDSVMEPHEQALQNVWQAMLVRRIWYTFSWHQSIAVLLTFNEDDFQKLVLNERNEVKHSFARDELRMDDSTESE